MLGHEKSRLLQRGFEARKYGASRRISMIRFAQKRFAFGVRGSVRKGQRKRTPAGDSHAFYFSLRGTEKQNKGVDQFLNWSTNLPLAVSDMIRIPADQKKSSQKAALFWCSSGDSNPGHPA